MRCQSLDRELSACRRRWSSRLRAALAWSHDFPVLVPHVQISRYAAGLFRKTPRAGGWPRLAAVFFQTVCVPPPVSPLRPPSATAGLHEMPVGDRGKIALESQFPKGCE